MRKWFILIIFVTVGIIFIFAHQGLAEKKLPIKASTLSNKSTVVFDPWLNGFPYRKPITIDNSSNANELTDYQVKITVNYDFDMQTDFDDIRFTDSDGNTLLGHWRESYTPSTNAIFWVKVPQIPASSNKTIYLYYGNSTAISQSSVANTFIREINGAQPVKGSWHLDEGNGTAAYDTSGNNNNGTLINGPTWVDGKFGKALSFDGVNDYVEVPDASSLDIPGNFTISVWAKWNTFKDWGGIIKKGDDGIARTFNYGLWSYAPTSGYLMGWVGNGLTAQAIPLNGSLSTGEWHHIVFKADGSYLYLYVEGIENNKVAQTITPAANDYPLGISDLGSVLDGFIDEVQIYNRALTAAEISDLYNNYGYTTTNYPGRVLVRKYSSPEPNTSAGTEDSLVTISGSATDWQWKVPDPTTGEKIRSGSATDWVWKTFEDDETGITVPRGLATDWQWGP